MNVQNNFPRSLEAENFVLGCLLIEPSLVDETINELSSDDFYYPENKHIMRAIETLVKNKQDVEQVTIIGELKRIGVYGKEVSLDYVFGLVESLPIVANVEVYVDILQQKSLERKLLNVVQNIGAKIVSGTEIFADLLVDAEKTFMEVVNNQRVSDFKRIDLLTENVISMIEANKNNEDHLVGIDTGYADLNNLTSGFKKNELIILAARPSIGKSTLALNLAANACKNKKHVAFFSLEMGYDQLIMRLFSTYSGLPLKRITDGKLDDSDMRLLMQAKTTINKFPLYIDQALTTSLRDIKSRCQKLKREGHLDFIIIDYLQLLNSGEKASNRVDEVGKVSRGLKELARIFEVPVLALSQLSRGIEQREDKRPVLADLRESGSIEQDADIVMFLHREAPKKIEGEDTTKIVQSAKTELIIAKNRQGMTGSVNLIFKGAQSVFAAEGSLDKKNQGVK